MKHILSIALFLTFSSLNAQSRIDPSITGKEVGGNHLLRLKPRIGEVFHYKMTTKTQVSIKNANDLFTEGGWPQVKPNDKVFIATVFFMTASLRAKRINAVNDFQVIIDSIHCTLDNNGVLDTFTSTLLKDRKNPLFSGYGVLTGYDFGGIYDSTGSERDIYAFYNVSDELYAALPDSLQTEDEMSKLRGQVATSLQKNFRNIFAYLPDDEVGKDSSFTSSNKEDYTVWGSIDFPMQTEFKQTLVRFEEQGNRSYAVIADETSMTPVERIIDEKEYKTTLPTFAYEKKITRYIDSETGMLAYSKQTEDKSYSMKIEAKATDKDGKSFVTVQRSKQETVVELMR